MIAGCRLAALPRVRHGFFGRRGGLSPPPYESLNAGVETGDSPRNVAVNLERAAARVLPGAPVVLLRQRHSDRLVHVTDPWPPEQAPEADALVTRETNVLLGIQTADCAPILLADGAAGICAALHAGWRGAFSGIVEKTCAAMETLGARRARIVAAVGPCIGPASYEVDAAFREAFLDKNADWARFFQTKGKGKYLFDLPGFVLDRLKAAGTGPAKAAGPDTFSCPETFFSHRRGAKGRQISLVGLSAGRE